MTTTQMRRFRGLLASLGLQSEADKEMIVLGFTKGRTGHSSDLSEWEAGELINSLEDKQFIAANKMRRKIISMSREIGYNTIVNGTPKADMERLNAWCMNYSYLKKPLNDYTYKELPKLVTQFQAVYKYSLNNMEKKRSSTH